jgi:hypothetical protein
MNKNEALKKIEELKVFVEQCDRKEDFVTIDYSVISKEKFEKYGVKPFQIMKRKMRNDDKVWANITFNDAKKEAEKAGMRLPGLNEMLLLLDSYKEKYLDNASCYHKEFLGIEELSYNEEVCYEWIDSLSVIPFLRGGNWYNGSHAGAFALLLSWSGGNTSNDVGFRCVRGI